MAVEIAEEMIEMEFEEVAEDDILFPQKGNDIFTSIADPEIDSLYKKHKKGTLVLQPDFQRQYVWDEKKQVSL